MKTITVTFATNTVIFRAKVTVSLENVEPAEVFESGYCRGYGGYGGDLVIHSVEIISIEGPDYEDYFKSREQLIRTGWLVFAERALLNCMRENEKGRQVCEVMLNLD